MNLKIQGLMSRFRNLFYRLQGVKIQGYVWLRQIEIPRNYSDIQLQRSVALDRGVTLLCSGVLTEKPKIYIGERTYINRNTFVDATEQIWIGKDCAIGPNCYITDHDHGLNPSLPPLDQPMVSKPTFIGNQVWLGAHVTVLKGVKIGDQAVIGAGSVVTRNIPERTIAVGVPAKVIKMRSTE